MPEGCATRRRFSVLQGAQARADGQQTGLGKCQRVQVSAASPGWFFAE